MPSNEERKKIAQILRMGIGSTDDMSDDAFIEWIFSVISDGCDGHILTHLANLAEPQEEETTTGALIEANDEWVCDSCGGSIQGAVFIPEIDAFVNTPIYCPACGRKVIHHAD